MRTKKIIMLIFAFLELKLYFNDKSNGCKKPRVFSVTLKPTMRCWCNGSI